MEKKKKIRKTITNLIIFILLIILTFSIVFQGQDVSEIFNIIKNVKKNTYLLE